MNNELKYEAIKDMIQKFHDAKAMTDYIHPDLLPDIALYMDQVTTFMDEHLKNTKRYPDDKILTKTTMPRMTCYLRRRKKNTPKNICYC